MFQQFNHISSSCSGSWDPYFHALCVCPFIEWNLRLFLCPILCSCTLEVFTDASSLYPLLPLSTFLNSHLLFSRVFLILIPALLQYHSKALCHCSVPSSNFLALLVSLTLLSLAQLSCSSHFFHLFRAPFDQISIYMSQKNS